MTKLFVLVGIPGSGKSFIGEKLAEKYNARILSSDKYRGLICGDENCQARNQEVFSQLYRDLISFLKSGINCVFDATNVTRKDRARIFNQIKAIANVEVIAYVMRTPIEVCIERDAQRERTVGVDVIHKFVSRYQFPQKFEGFSQIIIDNYIEPDSRKFLLEALPYQKKIQEQMEVYDQENPHHIHTLLRHSVALAEHYDPCEGIEYQAGRLHDIGKLYTKSYDDQGIAHYYNHDSWGIYKILESPLLEFLTYKHTEDELYEALALINYHMKAHKDIRGSNETKYRKIFGDSLYNKLIKFADADIEASYTEPLHEQLKYWIKVEQLTLEKIRNKPEWRALKEKVMSKYEEKSNAEKIKYYSILSPEVLYYNIIYHIRKSDYSEKEIESIVYKNIFNYVKKIEDLYAEDQNLNL